jgi:hypothetical protein
MCSVEFAKAGVDNIGLELFCEGLKLALSRYDLQTAG